MKTFENFLKESSEKIGFGKSWPNEVLHSLPKTFKAFKLAAEAYAQHRYEEGLKADRQIDRDQLDILFHNYFDCYADDGDYGLPAMTFNRFIETVEKIMKSPPLPAEETKNQ